MQREVTIHSLVHRTRLVLVKSICRPVAGQLGKSPVSPGPHQQKGPGNLQLK
jgi:hypothetical protein